MQKPTKNKAILEPFETKTETNEPAQPEENPLHETNPRSYIEAAGWKEVAAWESVVPDKRWKDPTTSGPGTWFYSFDRAVEEQKKRDGFTPMNW